MASPVGYVLLNRLALPLEHGWFAPAERERWSAMRSPYRRDDFRLGRWTAKQALVAWLGGDVDFPRLEIAASPNGAPVARLDGEPLPVGLAISHRAQYALAAVAAAEVRLGCDLERIEERTAAFVRDFFTARESAAWEGLDEAQRPILANLVWSAKESVLKALGVGLRADTREVEIEVELGSDALATDDGWRRFAARCTASHGAFAGWWRRDGDLVLTIVADPPSSPPRALRPIAVPVDRQLG